MAFRHLPVSYVYVAKVALVLVGLMGISVSFGADFAVKESCLDSVRKYNYDLALQQCEYEAERGSAVAAEILGYVYLKGKSGVRDWDLARRYFEQARNSGDMHASGFLGVIYWHGLGVERDETKARNFFAECSSLPAASGSVSCAPLFARTLSLENNYPTARQEGLEWYKKLVDSREYVYLYNYAAVAFRLGHMEEAYANAEFFKMWAKRYGELWNLRQKYQSAERISARAVTELTSAQAGQLSLEVRKKLIALDENKHASGDANLSDIERAAYILKWQE